MIRESGWGPSLGTRILWLEIGHGPLHSKKENHFAHHQTIKLEALDLPMRLICHEHYWQTIDSESGKLSDDPRRHASCDGVPVKLTVAFVSLMRASGEVTMKIREN